MLEKLCHGRIYENLIALRPQKEKRAKNTAFHELYDVADDYNLYGWAAAAHG